MNIRRFITLWLLLVPLLLTNGCIPDDRPAARKISPAIKPPPVQRVVTVPVEPPAVTWEDYDQAVYFYTVGRHDKAADLLDRIKKLVLSDRQYRLVNFLKGQNARKMDRPEQVEVILADGEAIPASLKPYAYYHTGQAKHETQQYRDARDWLDAALKSSADWPLEDRTRLLKAETLYHLGDDSGAITMINALLKTKMEGPAMLALAHIYEHQGQTVKARDQYLRAMKNSNVREVRAEASYKYKNLLYPVIDQKGQEAEKKDLVRLLRTEWRLDEAIAVADKLTSLGGSSGFINDLAEERALTLFFSGRLDQAMSYYQADSGNSHSQWMYARCLKRLGRWEEAAAAFLKAGKKTRATECRWEAGLCYLKTGHISKAQKTWGSLSGRKSRYRDDYLWHTGHFHFQNKAFGKAEEQFQALVRERRSSGYARGARYWLARSMEAQGKTAAAQKIYTELASSLEEYYYRMLAEQRLGLTQRSDTWPDLPKFQELISPENLGGTATWAYNHPLPQYGDLKTQRSLARDLAPVPLASNTVNQSIQRLYDLCDAGTMDLALVEAEYLYDRISRKRPPSAKPYSKLSRQERADLKKAFNELQPRLRGLIFTCLAESGEYDRFLHLQYKHIHQMKAGLSEEEQVRLRRRLYPLAYPREIGQASRETGLHPALVLALMRTESNYQRDIMSVANARGLMQILPSTGAKIADRRGEPAPSLDALFDPEINIKYGAWYLSALVDEFGGQYPLAIASYNGGPFNVKRWIQQAGPVTLEEFIETIPFDQTQKYVKKVLSTFYIYRLLYMGRVQTPNLDRPLIKTYKNNINF